MVTYVRFPIKTHLAVGTHHQLELVGGILDNDAAFTNVYNVYEKAELAHS